jgi:hypothetical protein
MRGRRHLYHRRGDGGPGGRTYGGRGYRGGRQGIHGSSYDGQGDEPGASRPHVAATEGGGGVYQRPQQEPTRNAQTEQPEQSSQHAVTARRSRPGPEVGEVDVAKQMTRPYEKAEQGQLGN